MIEMVKHIVDITFALHSRKAGVVEAYVKLTPEIQIVEKISTLFPRRIQVSSDQEMKTFGDEEDPVIVIQHSPIFNPPTEIDDEE